ncbi:PREDICTED: aldose 1-epimerase-like [Nelumbo nucifera]|uniref:Aldose 1-epimerase n=1 Tax=Nelumbo nucifera TaxID=4432 RepID=A0A1U8A4S3_NELNU|nr:PREDICTED: aldose 1-epimerase-like [Nelumbo nucifera]
MANFSPFFCFVFAAFALINISSAHGVKVYEIKKGNFSVKLTNWGATILSVVVPDKNGKLDDIVLGYDTLEAYKNDTSYFGAIVGRVANRIGRAQFTLNGTTYKLVANEGKNTLHGGVRGFSDVLWKVIRYVPEGHSPHVTFVYRSPDGDQGFPGNLLTTVSYTIDGEETLSVTMTAKAMDKATPVNLAQHTYWNLGGHKSGDILSETVQIFGSQITLLDSQLIPTGKIAPVKGTPYDFMQPRTVGSRIKQLSNGYDINYVLDVDEVGDDQLKKAATVYDSRSGRMMELRTSAPGVQFYTANNLKDTKGKDGAVYKAHAGLCLETGGFPDSVNHPNFPSTIVVPGKLYQHLMLYTFTTTK